MTTLSVRVRWFLLAAGVIGFAFLTGCGPGTNAKSSPTGTTQTAAAADPWPKFVAAVRNGPDDKAARGAAAELAAGLTRNAEAERPDAPDAAALDAVAAGLKLTPGERKYLAGGEYTPLDANHLSECLYLLDAANALGVLNTDPPAVRADAAFRFVCRQVVPSPAALGDNRLPPVPPRFVLSRGSGSGLERAFTFVALCRQLDLDAYLIGPPAAADRLWSHRPTGGDPKGPFWAVGVRSAGDLLLFDPWRGEPVPGKAADRPATLAELRADPSACPWAKDDNNPWVPADEVKASGLFLSPPLACLSPRMALWEQKLKADVGVKLATDWATAVKAAEAVADGAPVGGWNPPPDPFTPVRALGSFLPPDQGGLMAEQDNEFLLSRYQAAQLPADRLRNTPPQVVREEAKQELGRQAAGRLLLAFMYPPTPRERLQRGQYNVATSSLVAARDEFSDALTRSAAVAASSEAVQNWLVGFNSRYDSLSRAKARNNPAEVAAAEQQAAAYLRSNPEQLKLVVAGMVAEVGLGEAQYLLALIAHEQAEAAEVAAGRPEAARDARAKSGELWKKASNQWKQYARTVSPSAQLPGRKATADALAARAERLAK